MALTSYVAIAFDGQLIIQADDGSGKRFLLLCDGNGNPSTAPYTG